MNSTAAPPPDPVRVRIFVDFWNFTLAIGGLSPKPLVDWSKLGPVLATEAGALVDPARPAQYEGLHVYGSYDPGKSGDAKLRNWFTNTLDKMPGVNVVLLPRQRKRGYPRCPNCQAETTACHACKADMRGTEEKGIDTHPSQRPSRADTPSHDHPQCLFLAAEGGRSTRFTRAATHAILVSDDIRRPPCRASSATA